MRRAGAASQQHRVAQFACRSVCARTQHTSSRNTSNDCLRGPRFFSKMSNSALHVTKDALTASLGGFASKRERVAVAACHTALREYAGVWGLYSFSKQHHRITVSTASAEAER